MRVLGRCVNRSDDVWTVNDLREPPREWQRLRPPASEAEIGGFVPNGALDSPYVISSTGFGVEVAHSGRGALAAGTYYLDDRYFINASRLTFTVPAGWTAEDYGELYTLLAGRLVMLPR